MSTIPSVTAEREADPDAILLKIAAETFEVNLRLREDDLPLLERVASTGWIAGALRIGRSAEAPVHWSVDDGRSTLLIGHDDETWGIGLTLPASLLSTIIAEADRCRRDRAAIEPESGPDRCPDGDGPRGVS